MIKRPLHLALTMLALVAISGCASPTKPLLYPAPIELDERLRHGFQSYEALPVTKAFAGASDGFYGYNSGGDEPNRAMRTALSNCQAKSQRLCRVFDVNGQSFQETYLKYAIESRHKLDAMSVPPLAAYHFEAVDYHVSTPQKLSTLKEGYHAPTPLVLDGVKTINTRDVAKRLKAGDTVVIDARGFTDEPMQTLPGAYDIDWAGATEDEGMIGLESRLMHHFERVMQLIAPDKSQSLIVFCGSAECWLSVNAVLRIQSLGYTNVIGIAEGSRPGERPISRQ